MKLRKQRRNADDLVIESLVNCGFGIYRFIPYSCNVDKLPLMSLGLGKIDNENRREAAAPLSIHSQSVAHSMRYGIFSEHVDPRWQSSRR